MKQRIMRWILINLLASERAWATVLGFLLIAAAGLIPLVLVGWMDVKIAFLLSWVPAIVCASAAHVYRGRAILWEAMCRKAQREGNEFIEGFLQGRPKMVEIVIQSDGGERMLN